LHRLSVTPGKSTWPKKMEEPVSKVITNINDVRIGRIVKREREYRCMTQVAFATAIGCDQSTLASYESGKRPIPANRVPAIAAALELDQRYVNPKAA
jgi:predicted transcriptional regulator